MSQPKITVLPLPMRDDLWRYQVAVAPAGKDHQTLTREFAVHGEKFIHMTGQTELEMVAVTLEQAAKQLLMLEKVCRHAPPEEWKP